ncbi:hypothetical protein ACFQ4K_06375 [Tistrella bauzanensis]
MRAPYPLVMKRPQMVAAGSGDRMARMTSMAASAMVALYVSGIMLGAMVFSPASWRRPCSPHWSLNPPPC